MKLLSIAIPCYNSEAYMEKCVNSLLVGGDLVEIIIVNDGSTDKTKEIAERLKEEYPTIIKTVHKENGGHGSAVNAGIANASGLYFKVVDSDDWVNEEAYKKILETLLEIVKGPDALDVLISNYVYEKQGAKKKRVMRYSAFPKDRIFKWSEMTPLPKTQYVLMHSLIYRTELLRECGLQLPEHTFYVDNLFAFQPMGHVKSLYYLDVNFYRYFIGRQDQSVNESIMIQRIDQQLRVNKLMIDSFDAKRIVNKMQRKFMVHSISIIMLVSSILLLKSKTEENLKKKDELWKYLKEKDAWLYLQLRYSLLGRLVNLPGKGGRNISIAGYKLVQKIYGFN
ncbi:MAG TPA: glycosyltransferase [Lachnospiraceae bacterium]